MPTDRTLTVVVTGPDRPGLTAALSSTIATHDAVVLDLEQIVVRGHLTLGFLLGGMPDHLALVSAIRRACAELDLECWFADGEAEPERRTGKAVVTVLGAPLTAAHVASVTAHLRDCGANIDRIRRLSRFPLTSVEFAVSQVDLPVLRIVLASTAVEHGIDIAVSPAGLARHGRRLVVMDVDSTLIQDEVIELLARHAGREAEVAAVTEAAMRGELDFAQSLHARVQALAGLPESVFEHVRAAIRLTPGARTLVRTLKRLGFTVAVVSGGFIEVVQPLADELGIDHARANRLEVVDGVLTGRVLGGVVDRAGKADALRELAAAQGLPLSRTIAIGDGANDLDMLSVAGLGVAFNAKPAVRAKADTSITVPYLDAILFLLGITRDEIEDADAADAPGIPTDQGARSHGPSTQPH